MWPFKPKSPPQDLTEQVAQSGSRFNPGWAFTYERKRLPGPGTNNYAYENLGLVEFSPIGPAESNRMAIQPLQPAPLYVLGQSLLQTGVGGLSQGTIYGQPLVGPQMDVSGQIHG